MTDSSNKVVNFLKLLQYNEDYSKVITLKKLLSYIIFKNKIFKENFDNKIPKKITKKKIKFFEFLNKTIICFPNTNKINFEIFLYQVEFLEKINLDCNLTINDILAESMIELLKSNSFKETYSYCQLIGIQMESFYASNQNAFKNSNRLISSTEFETLRLLIGDDILSYVIKFCSLFLFDETLQNYIQLLGFSLKEKMNKLFTGQSFNTKFTSSINLNNFASMKSGSLTNNFLLNPIIGFNNNTNPNASSDESNLNNFINKKVYIPIQNFNVERTKIFYCTNFNRKLGLFKNSIFTKSKNKENFYYKNFDKDSNLNNVSSKIHSNGNNSFVNIGKKSNLNNINNTSLSINTMYNRIFENNCRLIPIYLEDKIKKFLEIFNKKLSKYEFYKRIFIFCPTKKNWKPYKNKILENLKKIKTASYSTSEEEKEIQQEINNSFTYLLSSTVEYKNVFRFIKDFFDFSLPKDFLGEENYAVLLDKIKLFISLNRFETFNKINLFDSKEFTFKSMKWLEFKSISKTTYREIGVNLKNFVMKNIIFWIFDFLIVQLIRSNFYVTEKQGDHYKSFYYHKKDWDLILKVNELKFKHQFCEINKKEAIEVLYQKDLTFGKLRLVPKPTTCRPIISYKKRTMRTKVFMKNTLFETQKVFKYLSNLMQSKQDNCVVFDYKSIIQKLRKFRFDMNEKIRKFTDEHFTKDIPSDDYSGENEVIKMETNENHKDNCISKMEIENLCNDSTTFDCHNETTNKTEIYLKTLRRINMKMENLMQKESLRDFLNPSNLIFDEYQENDLSQSYAINNSKKDSEKYSFLQLNTNKSILNYSTMDIEGCYDNIDIDKIISIMDEDELISETFASNILYVILPKPHMLNKKFENNVKFKDCFEIKKLFFVSDNSEYLHFIDFLKSRNDLNYSYCVLYPDYTNMTYLHKKEFLPRIKNIINNNIIKFNKKYFKQIKGIPQGLSVSSFLCNLYFYNIEKSLCREYYKQNAFTSKLLLRFMDDYLCISTNKDDVMKFVGNAKILAKENNFNFNLKKSKNNIENKNKESMNASSIKKINNDNNIIDNNINKHGNKQNNILNTINFEDDIIKNDIENTKFKEIISSLKKANKFNWNGINFEMENKFNFNMFIDSKDSYDIKQYATLININLPALINKFEYNWIYKKICSIFLTGHPWVYFITELNSLEVLLANFKDFVQVITFKLIIFTSILSTSSLKPSQGHFIEIIDTCLKKLFFYFNNKMIKAHNKLFFLKDFEIFIQAFYLNMYENYEDKLKGNLKVNLIKYSPYLFKCIRRKILRMRKFRDLYDNKNFNL